MRASNGLIPVSTKAYRQTRKPISRVCRTYVCLYAMTRNTQKTRYKKNHSEQSERIYDLHVNVAAVNVAAAYECETSFKYNNILSNMLAGVRIAQW